MPRARSLRSLALAGSAVGSKSPPRPSSPTFSATTNASQMDLSESVDTIITRADLRASIQAYDNLINSCTAYRTALLAMSRASSDFASAMDTCSRLKGVTDDAGMNFQAAGGLHYLMANHWDVLGHTLEQNFEEPLRQHLGHYRAAVVERSAGYERTLHEKSKIIKQTEAENMNFGRKKKRDLQSFRQALSVLQAEVDELDRLKVAHYTQILDHEEEVWDVVSAKVCLVVRSSLDVFDRVTSKASDSVLETMVQSIPDPFDSYGPPKKEDQIYSILTPLAMTPEGDTSLESVHPWAGHVGITFPRSEQAPSEWDDALSPGRARRHSAPLSAASTSTLPASSPLAKSTPTLLASTSALTTPTSTRRSQSHLPTILSVINETRGRSLAQETRDSGHPHNQTENGVSDDPHDGNDITPTNTIRRTSPPSIVTRSQSPVQRNGIAQDTSGGQLAT